MTDSILTVSYAVLPGSGEDSFALRHDRQSAFLCVADGCGGLGSRRYPAFDDHTGAYAASRLAVQMLSEWFSGQSVPLTEEACQEMRRALEAELDRRFRSAADEKCTIPGIRITGTMQRRLPTTVLAALADEQSVCFFWAGDSRAYFFGTDGLHQCTQDHLKGCPDAFESLYRDVPLSAFVSADTDTHLSCRRFTPVQPGILLLATDGVYNALPTPMEFEMLLLDTLKAASGWDSWQRKLETAIAKAAQDDATLLMIPFGEADFSLLRQQLLPRREVLQKQFITPVRRKKGDVAFARERWQNYRRSYDWTKEEPHE